MIGVTEAAWITIQTAATGQASVMPHIIVPMLTQYQGLACAPGAVGLQSSSELLGSARSSAHGSDEGTPNIGILQLY